MRIRTPAPAVVLATLTTCTWFLVGCTDGGGIAPAPSPPPPPIADPAPPPDIEPSDLRIRFAEVSAEVGIEDTGISFGASVGDLNGDGWPDIFVSGHSDARANIWRNRGDGTFELLPETFFAPAPPTGDLHGAQWIDLDRDGRDELMLMTGACFGTCEFANYCFFQQGNGFVDRAAVIGVAAPLMRGRTPLALDSTDDGRVDFLLTAFPRADGQQASTLLLQDSNGTFTPATGVHQVDLAATQADFGLLGDLDGDDRLDALIPFATTRAFSFAGGTTHEITSEIGLPNASIARDACIADLTGDGSNEIYFARRRSRSGFHVDDDGDLEVQFLVRSGTAESIVIPPPSGDPSQPLSVRHGPIGTFPPSRVFFGAGKLTIPSNDVLVPPEDAIGLPSFSPGVDSGIYIGWNPATQRWHISASSPAFREALIHIENYDGTESDVQTIGFDPTDTPQPDTLLARRADRYTDIADDAGLGGWLLDSRSVVAADFDNDMDLDLYVVVGGPTSNPANVMFENSGDGHFTLADAPGAAGPSAGIGDTAATLDYDRDGRVDLLLTNGPSSRFRFLTSTDVFSDDAPVNLLQNRTDRNNHWIGFDLVGTSSNRPAIGAQVRVTTGDGTVQLREQSGGMHRYTQNSDSIHFGLGPHTVVAQVEVLWPNGGTTILTNLDANRYVTVVE